MRNLLTVSILVCINIILLAVVLLFTTPSFSHHVAGSIVDDNIYEMIDAVVADTPHADMVLDSIPETDTTIMTITTGSPKFLEDMFESGIMDYFGMLNGYVTVVIEYGSDTGTTVMTITQVQDV